MFHSARIQLTSWYVVITLCISLMFSTILYRVLMNEVMRFEQTQRFRIERWLQEDRCFGADKSIGFLPPLVRLNLDIVEETRQRILVMLAVVNASVIIISGSLGYLLAGRTLKPIREMVTEQNRFVSDASHELKTPLTSLKTAFEVYLRGKDRTHKEAEIIISESIEEVNRLQSLSESLLQLAQYGQPNGHSQFTMVSLEKVLQQSIRNVTVLAKAKNITLSSPTKDLHMHGNEGSLIDLFTILLDNAIKYSPDNSEISVQQREKDSSVSVSIQDQGIGIAKKDIPHVFDRFYRADTARVKSTHGGYGLGLAIAKKIVENHKGTISVESELSKGSTFTVKIPKGVKIHIKASSA